jgi:hypothetical protein
MEEAKHVFQRGKNVGTQREQQRFIGCGGLQFKIE